VSAAPRFEVRMRVKLTAAVNFALVAACMLAAGLSSVASAQTPERGPSPPATARESDADASADISITAHVTANSLRFEKVPNPRVEFTGRQKRETAWVSERENLPQEVRPGETYRNVGITLHIRSVFADIDRIVAEALGEVPPSDDAPRTPAQPQSRPPGPSTPPAESNTPPTQAPANAATRHRRVPPARRGRGN
jgi:hypothetical protein